MDGFWKRYLRSRAGVFLLFLLSCAVFAAVFRLYRLPAGAAGYPALLCAALWLGALVLDLFRAVRKHRTVARLRGWEDLVSSDALPRAVTPEDGDYQRLISLLREEHRLRETESAANLADMAEYYTLWAHQIKTPIASMRLTLQNEDSPAARRLESDLRRIEEYAEMVMVFLRLDSPGTDWVLRAYDLDGIVRGAVRKFSAEFVDRKLRLTYAPLQTTVVTDEKWLSFVLEQLLSNALKYTPEGSISIYIEEEKTLCIADTGIGIAPEDLPRIFEKGYTGQTGRADKRASGLGLYLCRRICGALGHGLSAQSAPGEGTVMKLDLSRRAAVCE